MISRLKAEAGRKEKVGQPDRGEVRDKTPGAALIEVDDRLNSKVDVKRGQIMHINGTEFGSITIDDETYPHDVFIRLSGKIRKRKKKLSKELYGTSHIVSLDEAEFIYDEGSPLLVVGTGQSGNLRLSPEAVAFFAHKGCEVIAEPTPRAILTFDRAKGRKTALFHVTC